MQVDHRSSDVADSVNERELRDELAVERTRLANERTMLAYVRTALALAAAGAVLLRFYSGELMLFAAAWVFVAAGAATIVIGTYRFFVAARKLRGNRE